MNGLIKARKLPIGTSRVWGDIKYVKTSSRWVVESKENSESIRNKLNMAQIPYNFKTTKNGSEYWVVAGKQYRISDHEKPSGSDVLGTYNQGNDFSDYNSFLKKIKSEHDLTDVTEKEKQFKAKERANLKQEQDQTFGTIYITNDRAQFDSEENALNYLWRKHLNQKK